MAKLFAMRVVLGKCTFDDVPQKLKEDVAKIIIEECGMPDLVPEEYQ